MKVAHSLEIERLSSLEIIHREPRITIVHHVSPEGTAWATCGRRILKELESGKFEDYAVFPRRYPRDFFGWPRLAQRAARADKCNLFVNSLGRVIGIRGHSVYRVDRNSLTHLGEIQGDCVLHRGICEGTDGWSYFGEYFRNPEHLPVRIWKVDPQCSTLQLAYEFPARAIRHVHGVFSDPFDARSIWVTTGDAEGECGILQTRDGFRTLETRGERSSLWRTVALLFTPDHVSWLTDSPHEQNYACRMDRETGALEVGQKLDCPAWYATTTREGISIGLTTVESGPGVTRDAATILLSEDAFVWREFRSIKKDMYRPLSLFKCGVILVPSGTMSNSAVWISGEGLIGLDGSSIKLAVR
jgi:hypothetical protein